MGYAENVGRVGALAVALGVGLAVASTPAVAWADRTEASSSPAGGVPDSPHDNESEGRSSETGEGPSGDDGPAGRDRNTFESGSGQIATAEDGDAEELSLGPVDEDALSQATVSGSIVDASEPTGAEEIEQAADPSSTAQIPPAAGGEPDASAPVGDSLPATAGGGATSSYAAGAGGGEGAAESHLRPRTRRSQSTVPTPAAVTDLAAEETPNGLAVRTVFTGADAASVEAVESAGEVAALQTPAKRPEKVVAATAPVIRKVLSAVTTFLAPVFGPDAPLDNPLLWGMLAWVRRQFTDTGSVMAASAALAAANSAPVAVGDAFAGVEDKVVKGNVLTNDNDVDANALTASLVAGPNYGVVTLNSNGSFIYTPNINYHGTDTFTYTAFDGSATSNIAAVTLTLAAVNDIVFQFNYGTGSEYWTPQARAALEAAANRLSEYFATRTPVTLTYNVTGEYTPSVSTLARGGMAFGVPSRPAGFSNPMIKKITSRRHTDANRRAADGNLFWNFAATYSYDDSPAANEIDFQSVAMHELLHSLGYQSMLDTLQTNRKTWLTYDKFIVDQSGARVISNRGRFDDTYASNLTGGNGGLFFGGANAVAAYGGPVPLEVYSVSHLRSSTFPYNSANAKLMGPISPSGKKLRTISPLELGMLRDMGYTVVSPPPSVFLTTASFQAIAL